MSLLSERLNFPFFGITMIMILVLQNGQQPFNQRHYGYMCHNLLLTMHLHSNLMFCVYRKIFQFDLEIVQCDFHAILYIYYYSRPASMRVFPWENPCRSTHPYCIGYGIFKRNVSLDFLVWCGHLNSRCSHMPIWLLLSRMKQMSPQFRESLPRTQALWLRESYLNYITGPI